MGPRTGIPWAARSATADGHGVGRWPGISSPHAHRSTIGQPRSHGQRTMRRNLAAHKRGHLSAAPHILAPKKAKRGPGGPLEGSRCPAPVAGRRRPALPPAGPAVPSALGGLTSGFGMGPGVPPLPWPPTGDGRGEGGSPPPPQGRTATRSARLAPSRVRMGGKSSAY